MKLKSIVLLGGPLVLAGLSFVYFQQNRVNRPQTEENFKVGFLPVT